MSHNLEQEVNQKEQEENNKHTYGRSCTMNTEMDAAKPNVDEMERADKTFDERNYKVKAKTDKNAVPEDSKGQARKLKKVLQKWNENPTLSTY